MRQKPPASPPLKTALMPLKRVLLVALALLVLIALGLPWWIGRDAERRYRQLVDDLDAPVAATVETYDRGWFSSRARVALRPASPAAAKAFSALGTETIVLDDRIAHGLVPWGAPGALAWRPALAVINGELHAPGSADGRPFASVRYRVPPLGGLQLSVESASSSNGGSGDAAWENLRLDIGLPPRHGKAWLELAADRLAVPLPDGRLAIRELKTRIDLSMPPDGLPTGSMRIAAGGMALATPEGDRELAEAEAILFEAAFDTADSTAEARLEGQLARVWSPRESYGPGRFRLNITGLDAASLERLAASTSRFAARGMNERALAMALAGSLLAEAPRLLAHGPVAQLTDASLASAEGRITAEGRLALDSVEPVVLNNPFLLQRAVSGTFDLTIPPDAARHGALIYLRRNGRLEDWGSPKAWLQAQVARGTLLRNDGDYSVSARLSEGRLQVNKRPWSALGKNTTDHPSTRGDYERQ